MVSFSSALVVLKYDGFCSIFSRNVKNADSDNKSTKNVANNQNSGASRAWEHYRKRLAYGGKLSISLELHVSW